MSVDIDRPDTIGAHRRAETVRNGMLGWLAAQDALIEAAEKRDWATLGYKDWDTYCEKEFSERRLKLNRDDRERAVLAFRHAGMSVRAIASAMGLPPSSVGDVVKQVSELGHLPAEITGTDGKTYPATKTAAGVAEASPPADGGHDGPSAFSGASPAAGDGDPPSSSAVTPELTGLTSPGPVTQPPAPTGDEADVQPSRSEGARPTAGEGATHVPEPAPEEDGHAPTSTSVGPSSSDDSRGDTDLAPEVPAVATPAGDSLGVRTSEGVGEVAAGEEAGATDPGGSYPDADWLHDTVDLIGELRGQLVDEGAARLLAGDEEGWAELCELLADVQELHGAAARIRLATERAHQAT